MKWFLGIIAVIVINMVALSLLKPAAALEPGLDVRCCQMQKEGGGKLPDRCDSINMENCDEILREWEWREAMWLFSWPAIIGAAALILFIGAGVTIYKKVKRRFS